MTRNSTGIMTIADVAVRLAVSPGTVRRYRHRDNTFPAPMGFLSRIPYWTPGQIDAWVAARPGRRRSAA